jgi:hypothetical protein
LATSLDHELLKLKHERLRREAINGDFLSFVKYIKKDYYPSWHHEVLAKELQNFLLDPKLKKMAVFMPPQHGKSELTSRLFPAFALGVNANLKIALASYSSDLANGFNRDIQRNIDQPEYREIFPNTEINSKNVITTQSWLRNSEIFEIVNKKGFFKSVGVGGGLTGRSVDLGIIDDPIKDEMEAKSETIRENVWNWYTSVFLTRLHNNSKQLLIMTRWHEDDLAGRILNPDINPRHHEWKVVQFEAIKENDSNYDDPRNIGEALWSERHNLDSLLDKKSISPETFAAQYEEAIIVDARKPSEFKAEHVEKAINIPLDYVNEQLAEVPKEETFFLHCAGGYRSVIMASILKARGYHNMINVEKGMAGIRTTAVPLTAFVCPSTLK